MLVAFAVIVGPSVEPWRRSVAILAQTTTRGETARRIFGAIELRAVVEVGGKPATASRVKRLLGLGRFLLGEPSRLFED